jgi:hypothetical protein
MERKFKNLDLEIIELKEINSSIEGKFRGIKDANFEITNKDGEIETPRICVLEDDLGEQYACYVSEVLEKKINQNMISLDDYIRITYTGQKTLKSDPKKKFNHFKLEKAE